MLHRLTDFSSSRRGKWIVIVAWIVLAAVIVPIAPRLSDVLSNGSASFLPKGAESTRVNELVQERFPSSGTPAILVFHRDSGLTDADKQVAKTLGEWLVSDEAPSNVDRNGIVSIYTVPQAASSLVSKDGTTMTMVVNVTGDANGDPYLDTIKTLRERVKDVPDGLEVKVSGPGGLIADLIGVFANIDVFLTSVTAALVLVLLIIIYRSPVIAVVPLLAVGFVFTITGSVGAWAAEEFGLVVNGQAQGIMTVLLFGAGTDYCLFIASRYREELVLVEDKHEAMRRTMRSVGEAIASAAGTVLVACVILLFAELRSTSALGPLLSIAVALMLLASLTLVPAIITALGRFAFWPFRPAYDPTAVDDRSTRLGRGFWPWIARRVSDRSRAWLAGSVGFLLLLALGLTVYKVTYDEIAQLPMNSDSRSGFELLRDRFPEGDSAPTDVYIVLPDGQTAYDDLAAIDAFSKAVAGYQGVASVESVTAPLGVGGPIDLAAVESAVKTVPEPVRQAIDKGESQPAGVDQSGDAVLGQAIGTYAAGRKFVSADGGVAQVSVVFDANPYGIDTIEGIGPFRDFVRAEAEKAGLSGAEVLVGGETATAFDTKVANDRDTRVLIPAILIAIGVILGLLLRSAVAPVYLLATIILSCASTLGISTVVFEKVLGQDGVSSNVLILVFVFLVALGIDYNIYLMARIREEVRELGLHDGVRLALARTGGVITSAGIILAGTFAALMTLPLQPLFQLGFAVAIGVLLDTFVVRSIVVPAIVLLLDKWNWWPSTLTPKNPGPGTAPAPAPTASAGD